MSQQEISIINLEELNGSKTEQRDSGSSTLSSELNGSKFGRVGEEVYKLVKDANLHVLAGRSGGTLATEEAAIAEALAGGASYDF